MGFGNEAVDQRRGAERIGEALAHAGVKPVSVRPIAASLEDVFIDLITRLDDRRSRTEDRGPKAEDRNALGHRTI